MDDNGRTGPRIAIGWRVTIFIVGLGAVQVVLAVGVAVAAAAYFFISGFDEAEELTAWLEAPETVLHLTIMSAVPVMVLSFAWVALCRRLFDRRPLRTLGLGRPPWGWGKTIVLGALAGASPIAACVLVLWALDGLRPAGVETSVITWLLFPTLLVMAFFEEVAFRGYLLRNFLEERRPVLGLVVTSVIFCFVHGFNPEVWSSPWGPLNLLGAGVVLGLAYMLTGELWFPTVMHFAWNLAQGVLVELPVSGLKTDGIVDMEITGRLPDWLTGGGFGLEASVLMTGAEVLLAVLFVSLGRRLQSEGGPPLTSPSPGSLPRTS